MRGEVEDLFIYIIIICISFSVNWLFMLDFGSFFFLKKIFIYLFWLCWVLVAASGIFVVACELFSCGIHVGSTSPTRDRTRAPCIGSAESYVLDHQGSPGSFFID